MITAISIMFILLAIVLIRNHYTYNLRIRMINADYKYNISHDNNCHLYDSLPSYSKMVFSFKLLRAKDWLDKEDLKLFQEIESSPKLKTIR
jgi:hypothetical protein